jgi:hypothetical protein
VLIVSCFYNSKGGAPGILAAMTKHARGTFDVKITPEGSADEADGVSLGRMRIEKQFRGDLVGTSRGEMLSARSPVGGSAGYVAMERVTATLEARSGSFVLQHSGTMTRGAPSLTVMVVPDSETGQLSGIAGRLSIRIEGGAHFYDFEYEL